MSIISGGGAVVGAGGAAAPVYEIERSLRFNSADTAYLDRTFGTPTSAKIGTLSFWCKRSKLGDGSQTIFHETNNTIYCGFDNNNTGDDTFGIFLVNNGTDQVRVTTQVFRDPSSWYHFVLSINTTDGTAANRLKLYVNGLQITTFSTNNSVDQNIDVFPASDYSIGSYANVVEFFSGYLTEINFIDGQALDPTSFGEFNSTTGVWQPIEYTGSYGTNGFYLNFSDNASTTTLGDDLSGNGNDWTTNNFSVTAGAGNDSLVDTPTPYGTDTGVGGEVRGNYCTLNPLNVGGGTLSNGNLDWTISSSTGLLALGTMAFDIADTNNKYYWEFVKTSGDCTFGIGPITLRGSDTGRAGSYSYYTNGDKYAGVTASGYGASFANNDVIGVAVGAGKITFYKNGVSQGDAFTGLTGFFVPLIAEVTVTAVANFGQRPFAYTAPSGFKALCTQNLPEPTIVAGNEYFDTKLWAGNSSTQSIALEFAPNLIWTKSRGDAAGHAWYDVLRGTGAQISSNSTDAETTGYNAITSFSSNAISLGADNTGTNNGRTNETGRNYVGWVWKANGAGVSNTDGTISSTVSVNTTSGFSIVTYTGTGSAATVGHGLGAVPRMIIVKNRDAADAWQVYHAANTANPETDYLVLNTTAATADAADRWNDTLPTSTVFSIGNGAEVNTNTEKYVAYCFAAISGYSAFGSYTGNGSADGPFVYTGFRPAFVMIKRTDSGGVGYDWNMYDNKIGAYNVIDDLLKANLSDAETTYYTYYIDFISNGFKLRETDTGQNASGGTYIYMAFAENPYKVALAR